MELNTDNDTRIPLAIYCRKDGSTTLWLQCTDHASQISLNMWDNNQQLDKEYNTHKTKVLAQELARFNCVTDWENWYDAIWFSDEESRTQFILTWS